MHPGNRHTISCLRPAVIATENALELAESHRKRTVWRMDGGSGSDEQLQWLLGRGYHVIAKGMSSMRAATLAKQVERWTHYDGFDLARVTPSFDYGCDITVFVKRRRKQENWLHSYYKSTLKLPSTGHFMRAYNQRGGAEVEQFRQDKQGLSLASRRKSSFLAQQGSVLLTDLAHNLLSHFRHFALADSDFRSFGFKRIVRDLLHIPGTLIFDNGQLKRIELLSCHANSQKLIFCLEKYLSKELN